MHSNPDNTMLGGDVNDVARVAALLDGMDRERQADSDETQVLRALRVSLPPEPMPSFEIDKPVSRRGRGLLGGAALLLVVALPLFYVYDRGLHDTDPPPAAVIDFGKVKSVDVTPRVEHSHMTPAGTSQTNVFALPATRARKQH
jgi:hypothetical protein